jgi:hypothetical protein
MTAKESPHRRYRGAQLFIPDSGAVPANDIDQQTPSFKKGNFHGKTYQYSMPQAF